MTLGMEKLFEKAYEDRRLLYLFLELTHKCNFACKFCYNPVKRKGQKRNPEEEQKQLPLTLNEYKNLLQKAKSGGVVFLTLTGGEPLLHPHFWEIMEGAAKLNFSTKVYTNGSLIGKEEADAFSRFCPFVIEISIYGASEKSYEESSGRGRAFPKVVKAIKLLKERELRVFLKCMLTSTTEKEMDKIQDMADELGCPLTWDPIMSPSEDGLDYPLKHRASDEGLEELFKNPRYKAEVPKYHRKKEDSICTIGAISVDIDPYGNVKPCVQWREILGNIREDDLFELWEKNDRVKELIEISKEHLENIRKIMPESDFCFGCPGRSRLLYGDPTIPDEFELKVANLRRKYLVK